MIESTARLRYLRMSPRKMRRVSQLVSGLTVPEAIDVLKFTPKRAALPLMKTIRSAASNAIAEQGSTKVHAEDMRIVEIQVDKGPTLPRIRFQGMGRVFRVRKRSCHVFVRLSDEGRTVVREKEKLAKKRRRKPAAKKAASDEE